ncbi:MAG TPA: hypothetical protein VFL80_13585 [Thermoanaerobaculia bacterium]|nr:hypothetical protein [Thermoanaerobaculia bacterium]
MLAEAVSRFTTRAYQPGDEVRILDLFSRSFHTQRSPEHFAWKYLENPWGNRHISVTLDQNGDVVGHYAGYVVPYFHQGADVLAHQIGDTMTSASVRHVGRGPTSILGRTAGHFYETFCRDKVAFNYGFNVSNIQKFSIRFLGSTCVEPVAYRIRISDVSPRPSVWSRIFHRVEVDSVAAVDAEWDDLFRRAAPAYGFLVRRDAAYVRWRYLRCPDVAYTILTARKRGRLVGWAVLRVREGRLLLGDLFLDPDHQDAFEPLLRRASGMYGIPIIEGWLTARPGWFTGWLERAGFASAPEPQDLSLMVVPFQMSDGVERMRRDLLYTMGDSDLF